MCHRAEVAEALQQQAEIVNVTVGSDQVNSDRFGMDLTVRVTMPWKH